MAARKLRLNLGFLPAPMRFEKAVEDEKSNTHAVCTGTPDKPHDPARVRNKVTCEVCQHWESSVFGYPQRGVEGADGKLIVLNAEELKEAAGKPIKDAGLTMAFHPREKVYADTVPAGSVNYLFPDKGGEKVYRLMVDYLRKHPDRVGVGVWAPVSVNTLWVVELFGDVLVMTSRCWPEQLRARPGITPIEVTEAEVSTFDMMVDTLTTDWDLTLYQDERKKGQAAFIAEHQDQAVDAATSLPIGATDIMGAMLKTLEVAKPRPKAVPAKKTAAKKTAAKKTAAKKADLPQTA